MRRRARCGPADLAWTEAAAALSTATDMSIEAQQITDNEQRSALHDAGISDVAVEGIVGTAAGSAKGLPQNSRAR